MRNLVSVEGEQTVIGIILAFPDSFEVAADLVCAEDFTDWRHKKIFTLVESLYEDGAEYDAMLVCHKLGDDECANLAMQLSIHSYGPSNLKAYCEIIKEKSKFRGFNSAVSQVSSLVNTDADYDQVVDDAQAIMSNLQTTATSIGEPKCSGTVVKDVIVDLDRRFTNGGGIDGLETGFDSIDQRWLGMKPGQLIVVAARPSMGKSLYGMQIVEHNAINKGKNCLVFSLEMTSEELTERMIASVGRIPYGKIKQAECFGEHSAGLGMAVQKIKTAGVQFVDYGGLHINQLVSIARKSNRRKSVDLILVDHIAILRADGQSREREVADITGKLKSLAKELKCPVIALSQLNRGVESRTDKRPMMSDLRDSGSIEQDADIVQMLYRDDYYSSSDGEENYRAGMVDLFTRKFRGGEVGDDILTNNFSFMRMENFGGQVKGWDEIEREKEKSKTAKKSSFLY